MEPITITDHHTLSILAVGALVHGESFSTPADFLHHLIDSHARELYAELREDMFRPELEITNIPAFHAALDAGGTGEEFIAEVLRRH